MPAVEQALVGGTCPAVAAELVTDVDTEEQEVQGFEPPPGFELSGARARAECSGAAVQGKELWLVQLPLEWDFAASVEWHMQSDGKAGLTGSCQDRKGFKYTVIAEHETLSGRLYATPAGASDTPMPFTRRVTLLRKDEVLDTYVDAGEEQHATTTPGQATPHKQQHKQAQPAGQTAAPESAGDAAGAGKAEQAADDALKGSSKKSGQHKSHKEKAHKHKKKKKKRGEKDNCSFISATPIARRSCSIHRIALLREQQGLNMVAQDYVAACPMAAPASCCGASGCTEADVQDSNSVHDRPSRGRWLLASVKGTKKRVLIQRHVLVVFYHAVQCREVGTCAFSNTCKAAQELLKHTHACKAAPGTCSHPRCECTKRLLAHHRGCRSPTCPVCVPAVMANHVVHSMGMATPQLHVQPMEGHAALC
ncbi:hypothetical protein WJX72_004219 [[Myrmecia] bisecta]|uniref:histone acetyltransferase n=1 Tax=[Myrmecia] bisecta TaxID=41462 RepID=A0AAW1R593_9CHLO